METRLLWSTRWWSSCAGTCRSSGTARSWTRTIWRSSYPVQVWPRGVREWPEVIEHWLAWPLHEVFELAVVLDHPDAVEFLSVERALAG